MKPPYFETNRAQRFFIACFVLLFAYIFVQIMWCNTAFGYQPWLQMVLMLFWVAAVGGGIALVWRKGLFPVLVRYRYRILLVALIFLFAVQCVVGVQTAQTLDHDVGKVFHGARIYVTEGPASENFAGYRAYLHRWTNNMGEFTVLTALFSVVRLLGLSCYYEAAVLVGHLMFTAAVCFTFLYLEKAFGAGTALASLVFWFTYVVVYVQSSSVYTDTYSIWCAPLALYLWQCGKGAPRRRKVGLWVCAGAVLAAGLHIKGSVLLVLIALLCEAAVAGNLKQFVSTMLCVGIGCLTAHGVLTAVEYALVLEPERVEAERMPTGFWIMMGLSGENGTYTDVDGMLVDAGKTQKDKNAIIAAEIQSRLAQRGVAGYVQFLHRKLARTFGSGNGEVYYTLNRGVLHPERPVYQLVLADGAWFRYFDNAAQCVYLLFYVFGVAGAALTWRKRGNAGQHTAPYFALMGFVAFMLLWESNHRQLVNQWPLFIMTASVGLCGVARQILSVRSKS